MAEPFKNLIDAALADGLAGWALWPVGEPPAPAVGLQLSGGTRWTCSSTAGWRRRPPSICAS